MSSSLKAEPLALERLWKQSSVQMNLATLTHGFAVSGARDQYIGDIKNMWTHLSTVDPDPAVQNTKTDKVHTVLAAPVFIDRVK